MISISFGIKSSGAYDSWALPMSYLGVFTLLEDLGLVKDGKCVRPASVWEAIPCPDGFIKVRATSTAC
eukprot:scaffold32357_cov40-Prasinocladus_malaysianus.AAC.2